MSAPEKMAASERRGGSCQPSTDCSYSDDVQRATLRTRRRRGCCLLRRKAPEYRDEVRALYGQSQSLIYHSLHYFHMASTGKTAQT